MNEDFYERFDTGQTVAGHASVCSSNCAGKYFPAFYSLADTRVVGSTLGMTSLAAVGATASISTLFIGFLSGLANGVSILVAREYGADELVH